MNHLVLLIVLPLLTAFLLPIVQRVSLLLGQWIAPLVLLTTASIGIDAWTELGAGPLVLALGGFAPPMGINLYIDQVGLFLAVAMHVGLLLLWPAWEQGADATGRRALAMLLVAAGSGMALSGDLFNIYVFYELLAVATYGLVTRSGVNAAYAAAIRYLIISAFGAALILIGIAIIYAATGTLNLAQLAELAPDRLANPAGIAAFMLMLIGFGVKAELFGVNTWVPEVYATAQPKVTALLAGVVSKLALLVIIRILVLLYPDSYSHQVLMGLGILGVLSGELAAWRCRDLTRMLAFSSIGQLGIMFIAFSIPGEAGTMAGLAVALHHMLVKPALFLLADRWGGAIEKLAGAGWHAPFAAAILVLLSLSLIGIPPLPGFWAKLLVVTQLAEQGGGLAILALIAILAGAVLEAGYLFRVVVRLYGREAEPEPREPPGAHARVDLVVAGVLAGVLLVAIPAMPNLGAGLQQVATRFVDVNAYHSTVKPSPLLSGGRL